MAHEFRLRQSICDVHMLRMSLPVPSARRQSKQTDSRSVFLSQGAPNGIADERYSGRKASSRSGSAVGCPTHARIFSVISVVARHPLLFVFAGRFAPALLPHTVVSKYGLLGSSNKRWMSTPLTRAHSKKMDVFSILSKTLMKDGGLAHGKSRTT